MVESTVTALHVFPGLLLRGPSPGGRRATRLVRLQIVTNCLPTRRPLPKRARPVLPLTQWSVKATSRRDFVAQATSMKAFRYSAGRALHPLLGSVVAESIAEGPLPGPDGSETASGCHAYRSRGLRKRILCPVDYSECSLQALKYAFSLLAKKPMAADSTCSVSPDFLGDQTRRDQRQPGGLFESIFRRTRGASRFERAVPAVQRPTSRGDLLFLGA